MVGFAFKHGMVGTSIYYIYGNMKKRTMNPNDSRYEDYGGRGIKICEEWLGNNGFINFYKWSLENGYQDGLSIDRVDVNGNYEPSNCRWITMEEQARNKRNTVYLTINGQTKPLREWAEISGVGAKTIWYRYNNGIKGENLIVNTSTKSGEKWIYWEKDKQRWGIRLNINGKKKRFGTYATIEEAISIRDNLLMELNQQENKEEVSVE